MFKNQLLKLRNEKNISQQKFADDIGVSRSAVGMWESGQREPNFETLETIADYFNVSISFLISDSDVISDERLYKINSKLNDSQKALLIKIAEQMLDQ